MQSARWRTRALAAALVLGVFLRGAVAHADDAPAAAADRSFRHGVTLFDQKDFPSALAEFERAYALAPEYRVLYNIGLVRFQLGDHAGAYEAFRRYLADGGELVA